MEEMKEMKRFTVRIVPLSGPYLVIAWMPYSEQVGVYRQAGMRRGDTAIRYTPIRAIRNLLSKRLIFFLETL